MSIGEWSAVRVLALCGTWMLLVVLLGAWRLVSTFRGVAAPGEGALVAVSIGMRPLIVLILVLLVPPALLLFAWLRARP